ncbi:MAG: TM2 domain-containing protein [Treponema sp.]|jgi:predicted RNA-binding Zn-ribbon protein involved in translation (DUF1610 family)|nr:TM2 domain-containing protein [Treponema sp.]
MSDVREIGAGEKFCSSCGAVIKKEAELCPKCGVRVLAQGAGARPHYPEGYAPKNWLTALLLCLFLGVIGVHRFYVGKIGTGILQLLTLGGFGIWVLIDLITICCGKFTDKNGYLLEK